MEGKFKSKKDKLKEEKSSSNKLERQKSEASEGDILSTIINLYLYFVVIVMPFILIKFGKRYYVEGKVVSLFYVAIVIFHLMAISKKTKIRLEHKISLGFLFTICLSAIFSRYPDTVIWGTIERREGLAMFFVYIILFVVATSFFVVKEKYLYLILSAGSLMSLYTIIQMFGIDPIQKYVYGKIVRETTSIATIGNSNFVSSYLCMFVFIAMGLYIFKKKNIYLAFSTILFLGLLAARTRGGWVTFIIVCMIFCVLIIKRKECFKRALIMLGVFTVSFFLLNAFSGNQITDRAKLSNIFKSEEKQIESNNAELILEGSSEEEFSEAAKGEESSEEKDVELIGSASSRVNILKVAFKVFKNKPLIGQGPDTLGLTIKDDYNEDYKEHAKKYNEGMDKAHNEYLEYAASGGIFTLITYLTLVLMIVYKLLKKIKSDKVKIVFLAVIAYLIQAFINISVIMVAPLFWILLGYAVKIIYDEKIIEEINSN